MTARKEKNSIKNTFHDCIAADFLVVSSRLPLNTNSFYLH